MFQTIFDLVQSPDFNFKRYWSGRCLSDLTEYVDGGSYVENESERFVVMNYRLGL